jgi:hypothetical protein
MIYGILPFASDQGKMFELTHLLLKLYFMSDNISKKKAIESNRTSHFLLKIAIEPLLNVNMRGLVEWSSSS